MLRREELEHTAFVIASIAHKGQYRRDGITPYMTHPIAVAGKFSNSILRSIAILHDVIEDTDVTSKGLLERGISVTVVEAVEALSQQEGESYLNYILRVKEHPLATLVKIEDIKHNYDTVQKSKQERYDMALYILRGR